MEGLFLGILRYSVNRSRLLELFFVFLQSSSERGSTILN